MLTPGTPRTPGSASPGLPGQPAPTDGSGGSQAPRRLAEPELDEKLRGPELGADVLDAIHAFLTAHVAFPSPAAADAVTLWAAHCHLFQCFESTPRLALLSPEKQSGKTRCLEVLRLLVPNPFEVANTSAAALFRLVEKSPTILMDECDTYLGPHAAAQHEDIRGLINAGHRRGAQAIRCVGEPARMRVEAFPAFCPVALAGIGDLPDTVVDRAIVIPMRRRGPDEPVSAYRERITGPAGRALGERLAAWAARVRERATTHIPEMASGLTDRPADVWEPLLAVADLAGGKWPERARRAAVSFNAERADADVSLGVRLLSDLREVWPEAEHVSTATLLEMLNALVESPWGDLHGHPLDARSLARRLRPYGVRPRDVRLGRGATEKAKGYAQDDLWDAWARYLPASGEGGRQARHRRPAEYGATPSVADSVADAADTAPGVADGQAASHFAVASVADVALSAPTGAGQGVRV